MVNLTVPLVHRVAEEFRTGRVFLAGDAAHTPSPSGGFGMNTGIAGAADLGWKLTAALAGWAGHALLDSYQAERRPVTVDSLEEANANLARTLDRELPPDLDADTPEGEHARAEMAGKLAGGDVRREFDAPWLHLGARYTSKIIISEGDTTNWPLSSAPGARAPHAWLCSGVSTLDLFGRGFCLLCFAESDRRAGFECAFANRQVTHGRPLSVMTRQRP